MRVQVERKKNVLEKNKANLLKIVHLENCGDDSMDHILKATS